MIQSLERSHRILTLVRAHPQGIGLRELARQVGLHAATTNNLVRSLCELGYLHADAQRRYHLGLLAAWPSCDGAGERHLSDLAEAALSEALAVPQRASELAVLQGLRRRTVLLLRHGEGRQEPPRQQQGPLHDSALGQVLLAWSPVALLEQYLDAAACTSEGLSSPEAVRARLEVVRCQGWAEAAAIPIGRHLCGGALPLLDPAGRLVAACNLHAPRTPDCREDEVLLAALGRGIARMRQALGWES